MPRWSSSPKASSARSSSVYGGRGARRPTKACTSMPRRHPARHPRGAAGVAVVEADHEEAALGQHPAQLGVPPGHRAAEPHHQQQRLAVGVAEGLVADLDARPASGAQLLRGGAVGDGGRGSAGEVLDIGTLPSSER